MSKTIHNLITGEVTQVALSAEEIAEYSAKQIEHAKVAYKFDRAAEYPPIADYIDGIVKGDQAQVQAYIDACLAVKAKYPKG
jgi:hypothetical protein